MKANQFSLQLRGRTYGIFYGYNRFLMNFEYISANSRKFCNVQMFGLFTLDTLTMGNANSSLTYFMRYPIKCHLLLNKTVKKKQWML